MDTVITTPVSGTVLTSHIGSVKAQTNKLKVLVELIRDPDGYSDCFFSTYLYPYNNSVVFRNIGVLIEENFRSKSRTVDKVKVRIDGVSCEFIAVYCEYNLPINYDPTCGFFTLSASQIVHRNSAVCLSRCNDDSIKYQIQAVGLDRNGNVTMVQSETTSSWGDYDHLIKLKETHARFTVEELIGSHTQGLEKVSYFAISHGQAKKIFYLKDDPFFLTFRFRNAFNAVEYVDVVGTLSKKLEASREAAICNGNKYQYDQRVEQTFEMQTGALTDDEILTMEQLIQSRSIFLCCGMEDHAVIIEDHTIEPNNDDESLNSIKFKFRFVGNRPVITTADMDALMPSPMRIFTQEFTSEFV